MLTRRCDRVGASRWRVRRRRSVYRVASVGWSPWWWRLEGVAGAMGVTCGGWVGGLTGVVVGRSVLGVARVRRDARAPVGGSGGRPQGCDVWCGSRWAWLDGLAVGR